MKTLQLRRISFFKPFWQRLEAMPLPKTEESILLRVLVQVLVAVGIIATDIAAGTHSSLWAVPLSIIGAIWSWYRRGKRNVSVKFLIAIAMLLVMAVFFANVITNLNDTRLVLAELLIQLQVLHSFDLPRRKDLGYSMVIGLILLGVAGVVSQTLAFAPLLLLFLAIALPVLILDYRSCLGLKSYKLSFLKRKKKQNYSPLAPQRLGLILFIVLALGLTIFALMPRLPGYQLKTFPVSAPVDVENKVFDSQNRSIVNPGYVREGNRGNGSSSVGKDLAEGPGELDQTYYYGFNSKINQNLRGKLQPQVVLRIRSQAPGFWRVLAFDHYTGQGWEISRDDQLIKVDRPSWTYQFYLSPPPTAAKTKQVIQSYTAVSDLPNLIPALSDPKRLYFPTKEVAIGPEGSLRSPLGLVEGLTYTVVSQVAYRDRTLLGQASESYPENITQHYLQVPPEIAGQVRQHTLSILDTSPKPLTSAYEKALFLAQTLKQNYTVQPELPFLGENDDLVEAFLFRYQGGYPDHFSTVLTIMLRSIGIPARLATGFSPGEFNPFTGYYVVRNTDAHAITEVYFPQYGWYSFNPIPGHELIPPSFEESYTFSVLRQFWHWVAGWLPSPVRNFVSHLWSVIVGGLAKSVSWLWRFFSNGWVGLFTGLTLAIALSFLVWLGWHQIRTWQHRRWLAQLPPMESLYQQMLAILAAQGYAKHPAQTPLEYAISSRQNLQRESTQIIEEISQAYMIWRYNEQIPNLPHLQLQLQTLIRRMRRS